MATTVLEDVFTNLDNASESSLGFSTTWTTTTTMSKESTSTDDRPENYIELIIAQKIDLIYLPVIIVLGIIGNVMSIFVLLLSSFRESTTCLYLATIEVLDTLVLLLCLTFFLNTYTDLQLVNDNTCAFIYFMFFFVIHFDVLVLVAMTVERYIVVRFPLQSQRLVGTKQTILVIGGVGLMSFGINLHSLFIRSMVTNPVTGQTKCWTEGEMNVFFLSKIFPWIDSSIYCFIPLTTLFVLNVLIIRYTKRAEKRRLSFTGSHSSSKHNQVSTMLILVTSAFLVLTAPIAIQLIVQRYALIPKTPHEKAISLLVHAFTDNLMYTNHASNFLFYCVSGQRFRNELKKLFCEMRRKPRDNVSASTFAGHSMTENSSFQDITTLDVVFKTDV